MNHRLRVLHLPSAVGGNSWGLAQGERSLGIDAAVLTERQNPYAYKSDICLNLQDRGKLADILVRLKTFLAMRNRFDVFHFNFGSSLVDFISYGINLWDLPFYPKEKKIIFTFNGCDARQKGRTVTRVDFSACHDDRCYDGICRDGILDDRRRRRIEIISRHARHIFALNPDLMHFLPAGATFLPYTISGWDDLSADEYRIDRKIRIVHSPTNRSAKGSDRIISALGRLEKKYPDIEIMLVENVSHEEALNVYRTAHLIVDQVLIGWYGALGVEAMKLGKPLAVFIRDEDLKFIPAQMADDLRKAVIDIHPEDIESVLELYLQNAKLLWEKSAAGLEYVARWHHPAYVAGITKTVYEDGR